MTKVYIIGLRNVIINNNDWTKEINEIKTINPDKIFCIGMEESWPSNWFTTKLFDNLIDWLEEKDKFVNIIGGFKQSIIVGFSDRIQHRIIHEESLGCIFWARGTKYTNQRNPYPAKTAKLFTCYNHNYKIERGMLVDELARNGLLNDGIISLHNAHLYENNDGTPYVWKYHDGSSLYDEIDFKLDADGIPKSYNQGFFDIVTESCYGPGEFFITEKTLKSLGMAKPFITLSCKGYHSYLRDNLGIEFYDEMFDYSFDQCDNIEDRIQGIIDNVVRLKHILTSEEEKLKMYETIKPKLYKNWIKREEAVMDPNISIPRSLLCLLEDTSCTVYGQDKIEVIKSIESLLGHELTWMDKQ